MPALTLFPRMVINSGTKGYLYTGLKEVHEKYAEIGQQHPKNYGWYQSRWHFSAGRIYDKEGEQAGRKLWDALQGQKVVLSEEQLMNFLDRSTQKTVAEMIRNWDAETVR